MKKIVFIIFTVAFAPMAASDTVTLSDTGYSVEKNLVARIYHKEIVEAESMPSLSGAPIIAIAIIDLNRDGKNEIIANIRHSYWCGSHGCKLVILTPKPNGIWHEIASLISYGEIEVSNDYINDYKTIVLDKGNKIWTFINGEYQ